MHNFPLARFHLLGLVIGFVIPTLCVQRRMHKKMREVRKYAILAIFVVAAILTPPDVFSQLMMAGPMIVLYEVSIWVAVLVGKKKAEREKAAEEGGA